MTVTNRGRSRKTSGSARRDLLLVLACLAGITIAKETVVVEQAPAAPAAFRVRGARAVHTASLDVRPWTRE